MSTAESDTTTNNTEGNGKPRLEGWRDGLIIAFRSLPFWELAFVVLTTLIFGMFTWGFNPDDKTFRTTYVMAILVGLPTGMLLGTILTTRSIQFRSRLSLILALFSSIIFFIAYLWFFAKIPLPWVEIQYPSEFSGWHWADHYQMWLYYAMTITLGLRLGLSFNLSPTPKIGSPTIILLISGILIIGLFTFAWISGQWPTLFLGMAILELGSTLSFIPLEKSLLQIENVSSEKSLHLPFLIKILIPFMAIGIGIQMGLVYIAKIGNFFWVDAYLEVFLSMTGIFGINWGLARKVPPETQCRMNIIILLIGFVLLYRSLIFGFISPNSIFWILITGIILGNFVWILAELFAPHYPAWKKLFHFLFLMIFFTIGVAGGLAYMWYEPLGAEIVPWVLFGITLLMALFGIFYGKKPKTVSSK